MGSLVSTENLKDRTILWLSSILFGLLLTTPILGAPINQEQFSKLTKLHCVSCHGPEKQKGRFRIDTIDLSKLTVTQADRLADAVDLLTSQEMPPKEKSKLSIADRTLITNLLTAKLDNHYTSERSLDSNVVRRLNKKQFIITLGDVLGLEHKFGDDIPDEEISREGFTNNAKVLNLTPIHMEYYMKTVSEALDKAIVSKDANPESAYRVQFQFSSEPNKTKAPKKSKAPKPTVRKADKIVFTSSPATREKDSRFVYGATTALLAPQNYAKENMSSAYRDKARYIAKKDGLILPPVLVVLERGGTARRACNPSLKITLRDVPRTGLFKLTIKASKGDDAKSDPVLNVSMGQLSGGSTAITEPIGQKIIVTSKQGQFKEYELFGYFDDYPFPHIPEIAPKSPNRNLAPVIMIYNDVQTRTLEEVTPALQIQSVTLEGPIYRSWPPVAHQKIFIGSDNKNNEVIYAKEILRSFIARAYRGKANEGTTDRYYAFWKENRNRHESFEQSIKETLYAILCSPSFLYLLEPNEKDVGRALTNTEYVTRLSYFLWNGPPDTTLMELPELTNSTLDQKTINDQVERMINDKKSWRFISSFCDEWLKLSKAQDLPYQGRYSRHIKTSTLVEPHHFFKHLLDNNLSYMNCISSDFAVINKSLAEWYGIEGVEGPHFRPVKLQSGHHRGGLLTQGVISVANSDDHGASHPIRRGVWVVERILGKKLPSPPKVVEDVSGDIEDFAKLPLKKQLELHKTNTSCASCHKKIDNFGIPFENYDGYGEWRTQITVHDSGDKGRYIASVGADADPSVVIDNQKIANMADFEKYLLAERESDLSKAFVKYLCTYALGRTLTYTDRAEIDAIDKAFKESGYKLKDLVKIIVNSKLFRSR